MGRLGIPVGRSSHCRMLVILIAVLAMVSSLGAVSSAQAAVAKATLSLSPSTAIRGERVKATGRVPGAVSRPVWVQRKSGNRWVTLVKAKTTRTGTYATSFKAPAIGSYSVRVLAPRVTIARKVRAQYVSSAKNFRVVAQTAALSMPATLVAYRNATATLTFRPIRAGRVVALQVWRQPGEWTAVGTGRQSAAGTVSLPMTAGFPGPYAYRAWTAAVAAAPAFANPYRVLAVTAGPSPAPPRVPVLPRVLTDPASQLIQTRLETGKTDIVVGIASDSTLNGSGAGVRVWLGSLGALYPNLAIKYGSWNPTTGTMQNPLETVQPGAAGTTTGGVEVVQSGPAQTLTVFNGAMGGSTIDYSSSQVAAMYPSAPDVVLIATGHNNRGAASSPTAYLAGIDFFVMALHQVYPDTLPLIASQNPRFDPAWYIEAHFARQIELRSYAIRNGYGYVPIMEEFLSRPDYGASLIGLDGVHPTTGDAAGTGARFWADAFQAHLDARALVPRNSLPSVLHRLG